MKYDTALLPIGTKIRAKAQLAGLDLTKALKTCRSGGIELAELQDDFDSCVQRLFERRAYGVILSAYYEAGAFGRIEVRELLRRMYEIRDYSSFLKQAYRFDAYAAFGLEIENAIKWHFDCRYNDAPAWQRKFAKLQEQEQLRNPTTSERSVQVIEDLPDDANQVPKTFQLRQMFRRSNRTLSVEPEANDDPYIVSQTSRLKVERANGAHEETLAILRNYLEKSGFSVSESKLIDAYSVVGGTPAIFEIKSITQNNEREQIRHALSQLYEYRFLHDALDATLWAVFSQPLSSIWYHDYLIKDRDVRLLWIEDGEVCGPSLRHLQELSQAKAML